MKHIIRQEGYKFVHSRKSCVLFVLFLFIIVYMYDISVGKPVLKIYAWEIPEEWREADHLMQTNREITTLIQDVKYYGGIAGWTEQYVWIEENSMSLFQEDGILAEKWKDYDFPHTMKQKQYYDGYIEECDWKEFGAFRRFTDILRDFSAGSYISMFAPAFFFGTDFVNRSYSIRCFSGESRLKIVLGKYLFYLIVMAFLSLLGTVLPCLLYNREILQLPFAYVVKGIGIHCTMLVGMAALMSPFSFLLQDEWKTLAATYIFSFLLFSNRAVLNLSPFQFVDAVFWESLSNRIAGGILLMTMGLVVIAGVINVSLFQRAELK